MMTGVKRYHVLAQSSLKKKLHKDRHFKFIFFQEFLLLFNFIVFIGNWMILRKCEIGLLRSVFVCLIQDCLCSEDHFPNAKKNSLMIKYLDPSIKAAHPWEEKLQLCHRSWFLPGSSRDEGYVMSLRVRSRTLGFPRLLGLMSMMSLYKTEAGFGPCCCAYSLHGETCRNLPRCLKMKKTLNTERCGSCVTNCCLVIFEWSTHTHTNTRFLSCLSLRGEKLRSWEAPAGFICQLF